ncbi:hypothetical protein FCOIX_9922 [Fusarium coicis]|nr:hypothetical protein FCOIX_9922 [Fusarium coicis]
MAEASNATTEDLQGESTPFSSLTHSTDNSEARLLVTNKSDTTFAHIFQADIPHELLDALNDPILDMESFMWPMIEHLRIPFKPYASFAKRIILQLVGYEYSPAVEPKAEVVQRGEKRKRDESDAVGQRRNVRSWDSMQPAAVSMANRWRFINTIKSDSIACSTFETQAESRNSLRGLGQKTKNASQYRYKSHHWSIPTAGSSQPTATAGCGSASSEQGTLDPLEVPTCS